MDVSIFGVAVANQSIQPFLPRESKLNPGLLADWTMELMLHWTLDK